VQRRAPRPGRAADDVALAAWGILLAMLVVSGWRNDANPLPAVLLATGVAAAYAAARGIPDRALPGVLWSIVATAVLVVVVRPAILSGEPLAPPTGYGNANGSLLALGVVAALGAAAMPGSMRRRAPALLAASGLLLAVTATRSVAAAGMAAIVFAAVVAVLAARAAGQRTGRLAEVTALTLLGVLTAAVFAVTIALAAPGPTAEQAPGADRLVDQLSERRTQLWQDAADLAAAHPWTGVGTGEFSTTSEVARRDADTRFAHSLPLETAAETGLLAGAAVVVALVAAFAAGVTRPKGPVRVVAVGAVCVFAAQAFIDYAYRYPVVTVGWAVLAGATTAVAPSGVRHRP
jgi:O-antigen ligase